MVDTAQNVHRSNTASSIGSESSMVSISSLALARPKLKLFELRFQPFNKLLSRAGSQSTLVGSMHTGDKYGKLESEVDLESQPLQGLGGGKGDQEHVGPLERKWVYFKKNWRDVLVRTGVAVGVVGTVVSIIVCESFRRRSLSSITRSLLREMEASGARSC